MFDVNKMIDDSSVWIYDAIGNTEKDKMGTQAIVLLGLLQTYRKFLSNFTDIETIDTAYFNNLMNELLK